MRAQREAAAEGEPLHPEIPPEQPFPVDDLGPVLKPVVQALHERVVKAPLSACATCAIGVASLATQHLGDVQLPTGETRAASLSLLTFAESGERKSTLDSWLVAGIERFEAELDRRHQAEAKSYSDKMAARKLAEEGIRAEARRKKLSGDETEKLQAEKLGDAPQPPVPPTIISQNPTIESVEWGLINGRRSQGVITAEAGPVLSNYSMSEKQITHTAGRYNSLWDGSGARRERVGEVKEGTAVVRRRDVRLTVSLSVQPNIGLAAWRNEVLTGIGYTNRFLPCYPESRIGYRTGPRKTEDDDAVLARFADLIYMRISTQNPTDDEGNELVPRRQLSASAEKAYWQFHERVEKAQRVEGDYYEIRGFASKMCEQAQRLANQFAKLEVPDALEIDEDRFRRASRVIEWYAAEHARLAGVSLIDASTRDAEALRQWLTEKWSRVSQTFGIGEISQRALPKSLRRSADVVRKLITTLERNGHVKAIPGGGDVRMPDGSTRHRREAWRILQPDAAEGEKNQ